MQKDEQHGVLNQWAPVCILIGDEIFCRKTLDHPASNPVPHDSAIGASQHFLERTYPFLKSWVRGEKSGLQLFWRESLQGVFVQRQIEHPETSGAGQLLQNYRYVLSVLYAITYFPASIILCAIV